METCIYHESMIDRLVRGMGQIPVKRNFVHNYFKHYTYYTPTSPYYNIVGVPTVQQNYFRQCVFRDPMKSQIIYSEEHEIPEVISSFIRSYRIIQYSLYIFNFRGPNSKNSFYGICILLYRTIIVCADTYYHYFIRNSMKFRNVQAKYRYVF